MPIVQQYISRIQPFSTRETTPAGAGLGSAAAAPAEAVARLGGALTDFGSQVLNQISRAKDAMDLATLRGGLGDRKNALFNTLATTPDSAAREQLYNQAKQETDTLASKRPNVQRVFDAEKKLTLVDWQADFNTLNNRLQIREIQDQYQLNFDRLLEQDKVQEAIQLSNTARATMAISRAKYEDDILIAPNKSILLRMDKTAQEGNFDAVLTLSEQLKNPSGPQLEEKNRILKAVEQMQGDAGDAFQKAILKETVDADAANMDALSRSNLAVDIRQRIAAPGNSLSGEQSRVLMNWVDNWSAPGDVKTDWPIYQTVWQLIGPVARGEMKLNDALKILNSESKNLNGTEMGELSRKLISASEQKADAPEKDPSYARTMTALKEFETQKLFFPTRDSLKKELPADQFEAWDALGGTQQGLYNAQYSAKRLTHWQNEYDRWLKDNPNATISEKEKWLDDVMKLPKQEAAKTFLRRTTDVVSSWLPFGGLRAVPENQPQLGPLKIYLRTAINPNTGERMGTYDGKIWEKIP